METSNTVNQTQYSEASVEYPSLAIANEFIKRSKFDVSPMKLQKLVYYAHGWCLKLTSQPLIDDKFEAWPFGPVVSDIYHAFKKYGNRKIDKLARDYSGNEILLDDDDVEVSELIDKIIEHYGDLSAIVLSNKTHQTNSPWDIVYNQEGRPTAVISNELIKANFQP